MTLKPRIYRKFCSTIGTMELMRIIMRFHCSVKYCESFRHSTRSCYLSKFRFSSNAKLYTIIQFQIISKENRASLPVKTQSVTAAISPSSPCAPVTRVSMADNVSLSALHSPACALYLLPV